MSLYPPLIQAWSVSVPPFLHYRAQIFPLQLLVKPLSGLCSFVLIAHSPLHSPCSSLPWSFRVPINLCCWCPWRDIPLLLAATGLTLHSLQEFCLDQDVSYPLLSFDHTEAVNLLLYFFCQAKIDTVFQIFSNNFWFFFLSLFTLHLKKLGLSHGKLLSVISFFSADTQMSSLPGT